MLKGFVFLIEVSYEEKNVKFIEKYLLFEKLKAWRRREEERLKERWCGTSLGVVTSANVSLAELHVDRETFPIEVGVKVIIVR